ncbi:hypothetical protein [Pseudomonas moorei]|uniref:Uncharacterized protein n=1 Tax=Pseudomonas moorei TaxID=395599 RepID=A0A1H1FJQ6_9PSED|nr:hypothetical protein [Pseudomonas moorei]KAB0509648.1 hypothetical protein F7R06_01105 [Pseudomonas moorei]SDR01313.1 hypothetical protein SAMN04490195_2748 [Pseudomonas moorei]
MTHTLIAFASALLIVMYWFVCRRRSLVHREKAADLLVAFFDKKGVSESDKDTAYFFFSFATSWFFLPFMTVLAIPVILGRTLSNRPLNSESGKEKDLVTDEIMKMYMFRNPITGAVCFLAFFVMASVAMLLGLFANRLRSIPSPSAVYMTTATKVYHPQRRHAH